MEGFLGEGWDENVANDSVGGSGVQRGGGETGQAGQAGVDSCGRGRASREARIATATFAERADCQGVAGRPDAGRLPVQAGAPAW